MTFYVSLYFLVRLYAARKELVRCKFVDSKFIGMERSKVFGFGVLFSALLIIVEIRGFFVPGVAPVEFKDGQRIEIRAVEMTSTHTQLPYEYYSLPFCLPKNGSVKYKSENLGEILLGDIIVNTPYEVAMKENIQCRLLCHKLSDPMNWTEVESQRVIERIQHEYTIHLLIDNLPAATHEIDENNDHIVYNGYKLGEVLDDQVYIYNYLKLILSYHRHGENQYRVVGFEIESHSIDYAQIDLESPNCQFPDANNPQYVDAKGTKILFLYSVEWRMSEVSWASRWDIYLGMSDIVRIIHWFSIINSLVAVFFFSGVLTMIMVRTLKRDIARYNADDIDSLAGLDESIEETGWKLVHGDVFRPPINSRFFTSVIGSGIQIFFMTLITIFFAMLGMLSPGSRGALGICAIFVYVFSGIIAGYFSARLYKTMKGREWKRAALLTAILYPGVVFTTCFFLNFFIWGKHSSGSIPFTTIFALLCLWFGISSPLVYLGYFFGYRKQPFTHRVETNLFPRKIPEQQWYMNPALCTLMAGILPFGAVFIELFSILTALWQNQFYYSYGFLFLMFCILVILCSQISIVIVYFQLCGEDYRWWWRSFIVSGGSAVYVLAYSVIYFMTKLEIKELVPTLIYFGYTTLIVLTFWLLTGTIGFIAAYVFIRKIYGALPNRTG